MVNRQLRYKKIEEVILSLFFVLFMIQYVPWATVPVYAEVHLTSYVFYSLLLNVSFEVFFLEI